MCSSLRTVTIASAFGAHRLRTPATVHWLQAEPDSGRSGPILSPMSYGLCDLCSGPCGRTPLYRPHCTVHLRSFACTVFYGHCCKVLAFDSFYVLDSAASL